MRWLRVRWRWLVRTWRANLQLRVVATTMMLCLLVMGLIQWFTYQRIGEGLVSARVTSAQDEADYGVRLIAERVAASDKDTPTVLNQIAVATMRFLESQGGENARQLILTRVGDATTTGPQTLTTGPDPAIIPATLRQAIADDPTHQQVQVTHVPVSSGEATDAPAIIVGSRITLGTQQRDLYYVFALTQEQRTMRMVAQTFLLGSTVFALLIGLVAYLVTRLVVDPVRQAAVVAGRLSAGNLNERMVVKGEDDLARLAMSFNEMADHLQAQISRLEDLSALQQRFASDVSHELRTPLTTIRMATEMIHDGREQFDPLVARSAELLYGEVDRFEALLTDLLEMSRFDAGGAVLDHDEIDVAQIVRTVVIAAAPLAARRGSPVEIVGETVDLRVSADGRRVERILRNLVVNAIEHGEGRRIDIELGQNDEAVAVGVRDHGIGLRPGEADLVFNRFWRADPARKRTTGGTGLGLSIALEDANLHGGYLDAWGEPGEGSRFRLTLPRTPGSEITESPVALEDPPAVHIDALIRLDSPGAGPRAEDGGGLVGGPRVDLPGSYASAAATGASETRGSEAGRSEPGTGENGQSAPRASEGDGP